jgi:hypothetical protein
MAVSLSGLHALAVRAEALEHLEGLGESTVCDRDPRLAALRREMVLEPLHHLVVRGTRIASLAVRELEAQELLPQER